MVVVVEVRRGEGVGGWRVIVASTMAICIRASSRQQTVARVRTPEAPRRLALGSMALGGGGGAAAGVVAVACGNALVVVDAVEVEVESPPLLESLDALAASAAARAGVGRTSTRIVAKRSLSPVASGDAHGIAKAIEPTKNLRGSMPIGARSGASACVFTCDAREAG